MGIKISALPAIVTPALSDSFPVVQSGVTYRETCTQLASLFATSGANTNITSLGGLTTPLTILQGGTGSSTGQPVFTSVAFSPSTNGIVGTATNNNAASGYVGEYIEKIVLAAAGVSLTTATPADVLSQIIPAGDWDISASVSILATGNNLTITSGWTSLSSATVPDVALYNFSANTGAFSSWGSNTPILRVSIAAPTTVYLSCEATFGAGTAKASGKLSARRIR